MAQRPLLCAEPTTPTFGWWYAEHRLALCNWELEAADAVAPHTGVRLPLQQMNIFARYLLNQGDAADGRHNPIVDWIWWAWNDNSGDTGGIVSDSAFRTPAQHAISQHSNALLHHDGAPHLLLQQACPHREQAC